MKEIIGTVATTHLIQRGEFPIRMTREALESGVRQMNGDRAIPITVEHDPFCMPLGKTVEAWVEPLGDEFALMSRSFVDDEANTLTHEKSGVEIAYLGFEEAPKPFVRRFGTEDETQFSIQIDSVNFASKQEVDEFGMDVSRIDSRITCRDTGRFAFGPEPIILFVLSNLDWGAALAIGVWTFNRIEKFVRYTVDESLRKVGDEVSDIISDKIKDVIRAYRNRQVADERPILVQIVVRGDTDLILLARIESEEEFSGINLEKLTAVIEDVGDLLQNAEEATFAQVGENDWEFLYLKTRSGEVIGTAECYAKSKEKFEDSKGMSVGTGGMEE